MKWTFACALAWAAVSGCDDGGGSVTSGPVTDGSAGALEAGRGDAAGGAGGAGGEGAVPDGLPPGGAIADARPGDARSADARSPTDASDDASGPDVGTAPGSPPLPVANAPVVRSGGCHTYTCEAIVPEGMTVAWA